MVDTEYSHVYLLKFRGRHASKVTEEEEDEECLKEEEDGLSGTGNTRLVAQPSCNDLIVFDFFREQSSLFNTWFLLCTIGSIMCGFLFCDGKYATECSFTMARFWFNYFFQLQWLFSVDLLVKINWCPFVFQMLSAWL